jgi:hypothetical protein
VARRRFIRTATGVLFGGPAILAACTPDGDASVDTVEDPAATADTTDVPATEAPSTTVGDITTVAPATTTSEAATTAPSPVTAVVYRLSTRNQRSPCRACKAHAAHRYYATTEAADTGRAHSGCRCAIVQQQVAGESFHGWFESTDRAVFDDRWTT